MGTVQYDRAVVSLFPHPHFLHFIDSTVTLLTAERQTRGGVNRLFPTARFSFPMLGEGLLKIHQSMMHEKWIPQFHLVS